MPAVQWVCDLLRTELALGSFPDGVLPGEDALIRGYGVSRGTIRQALLNLTDQGVLNRVRGAGTFVVAPTMLRHGIDESRDLAQDVNAGGVRITIRTSYAELHPAVPALATLLGLTAGEPVVIMESTTSLDGSPLSLRTAFLPGERFAVLVERPDFDLDRSPYEIIAEVIGGPVGDTELQIGCSNADGLCAELLDVPVGFALLDTTRTIRAADGTPLEYSKAHARADRISFSTVMRAQANGSPPRS
ncbi:GntR family transcriptional regulator [Microlunatus sp. GCM10028923]|uniref:GntR family transcriptional regulator n=1 Tax=Microlunatus sp. GCM10028923 TaxID=3273400 RepID=UPI00361291A4